MAPSAQLRRICFTLNNWLPEEYQSLESFIKEHTNYAIIGKETGDEEGTPHLQGYLRLTKRMRFSSVKKALPRIHLEACKGSEEQNYVYCKKEGDYQEWGTKANPGRRTDLTAAIATLKESGIQETALEHPEVFVKYGRGLRDLKLALDAPYDHDDVRGIWIWGPPGTGKSHSARELAGPGAYLKPQSKWWDGYDGQEQVILDDLDIGALGHHLKIWADKYACTGETKGGTIHLRHRRFIVTTNYTPTQLWPEDPTMVDAIKRRFIVTHKLSRNTEIVTSRLITLM